MYFVVVVFPFVLLLPSYSVCLSFFLRIFLDIFEASCFFRVCVWVGVFFLGGWGGGGYYSIIQAAAIYFEMTFLFPHQTDQFFASFGGCQCSLMTLPHVCRVLSVNSPHGFLIDGGLILSLQVIIDPRFFFLYASQYTLAYSNTAGMLTDRQIDRQDKTGVCGRPPMHYSKCVNTN